LRELSGGEIKIFLNFIRDLIKIGYYLVILEDIQA